MTEITITYRLADECISLRTLIRRVFIPAGLGCCTLLVLRYALSWAQPRLYSQPSALKYLIVAVLTAATSALIYRTVYSRRRTAKRHFLTTYLKSNSSLHHLFAGAAWNVTASAVSSVILACIAYTVAQMYSPVDIACIATAAAGALMLSQFLGWIATDSLQPHVADLFLSRARTGILTSCVVLAVLSVTLFSDSFSPWSTVPDSEIKAKLRQEIRHPVLTVQQVNRAVSYFNVRILRARHDVPFPYGWLAYLFLFAPNSIALYAITCVFLGWDFTQAE